MCGVCICFLISLVEDSRKIVTFKLLRRWVILSSQKPTEVQISKLELKLYRKNQKCILVIALNPTILYMHFLTAQLNRTLIKKIKHEGFAKMHKISGNLTFQS